MSRRIRFGLACLGFFAFTSPLAAQCTLVNGECPPGRIRNPTAGLEQFQDIAYNSSQDLYFVVYKAGSPRGLTLLPNGTVGAEIILGPNLGVQGISIDYNPDRNEFLVVWRYDQPLDVWARYLDGSGNPIGNPFFIGGGATEPRVRYSTGSQRYVIVFSGIGLGTHYAIVAGDSTSASPLIRGKTTIDAAAFSARIAYSSVSNKFLIVYVRDFAPPTRADVWGRTLGGDGNGFGPALNIGGGFENQQLPEVGYGSTNDQFMVSYEDWSVGGFPDVRFNFVTPAGSVGTRLNLNPGDPTWNVPGPIGFDEGNGEFHATYFSVVSGYARQVKAGTGALDSNVLFGTLNSTPLGITMRQNAAGPQAAIVWRNFLGADGIHVSFIALQLPPPLITTTVLPGGGLQVPYSQAIPVSGGAAPLSFSVVSGAVPPGLSNPNPSTGLITGTPSSIGNFVFRARVQDTQGRFDEKDITISITLAVPTPVSPNATTNDPTPQFQWTASPTATSYDLVVDNVTDGGTVINQTVAGTSFTPGTPLVSGKIYSWQVRASDGANLSPFSAPVSFEVDAVAPSVVNTLAGTTPTEMQHTGLAVANSSGSLVGNEPIKTLDGNTATEYTTPGRATLTEEQVTYDLGASKSVGRVRLHSRNFFTDLMPIDFVVEMSDSPTSGFTLAHTVTNFQATQTPAWYTFNFTTPITRRYLRLRFTNMNQYTNGNYYVSFTEFEAWQTAPLGSVLLSWNAPSDDLTVPNIGTVVSYDIRYTTNPSFVFGSATPVGSFPIPVASPGLQTFLVADLDPETVHRFALTATDDAGNVSGVSNVAVVASKGFPPNPVTTLAASNPTLTTIDLTWTGPTDPPTGGAATSYDIRYSLAPITEANFGSATPVQGMVPVPTTAQQTMTVTGLTPNTLYYFAIKSLDGGLATSLLSNVASLSTADDDPPAQITTLKVQFFDDDTADLIWNATGDDGMTGTGSSFDVRYNTVPITALNFTTSPDPTGEPSPGPPGTMHSFTVTNLTPGTLYYFAIVQNDEEPNASPLSNVASATTLADLPEPTMTPMASATLTGASQTFQWAPNGLPSTLWWLYVGTTRGARDIKDSGNLGPALAYAVTGLPTDGSTVWVRLWYYTGVWGYADFSYTAHTPPPPPPPPAITVPAPNSTLLGASALFQWTSNGNPVTEWWLYVGSTAGGNDYLDSGSLGTATQLNVTGLPTDGSTVHVRLWYRIAGAWSEQSFQYTASNGPGGNPEITSPTPNSTLNSAIELFQWTANGAAVTEWWLYIGSSSASANIFDSGPLGTATQVSVPGLPTNGSQVFVRLWYRIAGVWEFLDAQYTATNIMGGTPGITSPAPASTLTAPSQLFQWDSNGAAATEWWLYAGSLAGANNYFDSGPIVGGTSQYNVTGLPVNGSTIHIRLWYRVGGLWLSIDAQYTAANLMPTITSPAPNTTLSGASIPFSWIDDGVAVTEWWLYAGSTAGSPNFFNSGSIGAATLMRTVTGLPTDGSTVHVTLWYRVAGLWQFSAFTYTSGP